MLLLFATSTTIIALAPPTISPSVLLPYDILKLVGFATGAALHLYLCWMILSRYGIRQVERSLLALGGSIGLWHLGNFAGTIYDLLDVTGGIWWMRFWDSLAYMALAFLPPTLAHAHLRVWDWFDRRAPRQIFKPLIALGYVPLVTLPWVLVKIWSGPYLSPIEKLSLLLLPFILWIVAVFVECALIDWRLSRVWQTARERRFFEVFGATLAGIGVVFLLTYVFGARHWPGVGKYFDLLARLSSLAPTAIVAYYIYRYRYLELIIRQSFVYAVLAVVVLMVYLYGIRRLGLALQSRYELRADVIEALLILVVLVLAAPLRRAVEHYLKKLFTTEGGFQGFGRAVIFIYCLVEGRIVAPAIVVVKFVDGHQLNSRYAQPLQIIERIQQGLVIVPGHKIPEQQLIYHQICLFGALVIARLPIKNGPFGLEYGYGARGQATWVGR